MRWIALVFAALFCLSCCCLGPDGDDTPEPEDGQPVDGEPTPTPTPGPSAPQQIDSQYLRVGPEERRQLTWTSTGPGTLTASISWSGGGIMTLGLAQNGTVAQDGGTSPLQASAPVGAAGEVWTIEIRNDWSSTITVAYTLTFTPQ